MQILSCVTALWLRSTTSRRKKWCTHWSNGGENGRSDYRPTGGESKVKQGHHHWLPLHDDDDDDDDMVINMGHDNDD